MPETDEKHEKTEPKPKRTLTDDDIVVRRPSVRGSGKTYPSPEADDAGSKSPATDADH